jgi:hypothetical protein
MLRTFFTRLPVGWACAACLAMAVPRLHAQNAPTIHDTTAYTRIATALRARPEATAPVVVHLPAGWPLHVSSCTAGWCSAATSYQSGYLPADSLTLQEPSERLVTEMPGVSVGVDLSSRLMLGAHLAPSVRLVAEVSYLSAGSTGHGNVSGLGSFTVDSRDSQLWIGADVLRVAPVRIRPLGAPCLVYVGVRGGVAIANSESKTTGSVSLSDVTAQRTDVWIGAVAGSELLASPHFSVGAEAQITKLFKGSSTISGITSTTSGTVTESWLDLETRGTLVLRFYP